MWIVVAFGVLAVIAMLLVRGCNESSVRLPEPPRRRPHAKK